MPVSTEVSTTRTSHSHSPSLPHIATQDLQRGSPTPKFEIEKPRGRRRSISPISSSSTSPPSSSKMMYSPPPLTWSNAFQDAKAGIHYVKDAFPTSRFLPPPFSREPVSVEPGDRVEVLEEIDEYAVRVRVLRTGAVGLIPIWNTEGALERLTRINTAFNEAATCPVEARAMRRYSESSATSPSSGNADRPISPTDVSLTHIHARCVPYATRVRFPDYYGTSSPFSDDDSDDSDSPLSPPEQRDRGRPLVSRPAVYEAHPGTIEKGGIGNADSASERSESGGRRKSVNFPAEGRPQVVFRYPSEDLVGAFLGEKMEGDGAIEESEDDEEWWWQGWEEACEEGEEDAQREAVEGEGESSVKKLETVEEEVFPFVFFEDDE
ncbi:hypothetical protein K466DRAFT_364342 [Polyporus arcularius HHB13444]|uniref:SH3 domain-containing protein n=1 Tax=Polyporus arcularius HHB13444 TaxID=1314778 RepID=A0A5C3NTK5_9APHY|nr:hypothetical protein K466DRAFT_364342 [Polyporus arcularius HHB13444]